MNIKWGFQNIFIQNVKNKDNKRIQSHLYIKPTSSTPHHHAPYSSLQTEHFQAFSIATSSTSFAASSSSSFQADAHSFQTDSTKCF